MGDFIGLHTVQMLIRRAGMIDLVKIHAVVPAGFSHQGVRLIHQRGGVPPAESVTVTGNGVPSSSRKMISKSVSPGAIAVRRT